MNRKHTPNPPSPGIQQIMFKLTEENTSDMLQHFKGGTGTMGATRDIIAKAMKDKTFRNSLLKDPKGAIKEFGVDLPAGVTIQVHENSSSVIHIVLPGPLDLDAGRPLSNEELQAVAGGALSGSTFGQVTACCSTKGIIKCPPPGTKLV